LTSQQQTIFDLPKVLAVGIASTASAAVTSRFGVAGTLLGLFLSAVFVTAAADFLKVYLARVPGAVTTIPGGFRKKSSLQNVFERMRRPFSKFASLPRARRRSILIGSVAAAGISFLIGLTIVTVLEVGVGKNLSCWVWDDCSTKSSADGSSTARSSTLPTILSGVQSVSSSTPQVSPSIPQQQPGSSAGSTPGAAPSQAPADIPQGPADVPGAETPKPSPSAQPGQRQGPSGVMQEDQQQVPSSPSSSAPADQQRSPADNPEGQ
jgi:hypothetical protein